MAQVNDAFARLEFAAKRDLPGPAPGGGHGVRAAADEGLAALLARVDAAAARTGEHVGPEAGRTPAPVLALQAIRVIN